MLHGAKSIVPLLTFLWPRSAITPYVGVNVGVLVLFLRSAKLRLFTYFTKW